MSLIRTVILGGLSFLCCSSAALADEGCEAFVSTAIHAEFDHVETQQPQAALSSNKSTTGIFLDDWRLARFVLRRYANAAQDDQLTHDRNALRAYSSELLYDHFSDARRLTIDVTRSIDHSSRYGGAETLIRHDDRDDMVLIWRVLRNADEHHILDVA